MTSIPAALHMYADSAIRFRDPFAVSKDLAPPKISPQSYARPKASWSSQSRDLHFTKALTPPPEMTGVQYPPFNSSHSSREHGRHFGHHMPPQQTYGPGPLLPDISSSIDTARNGSVVRPLPRSPSTRQSYSGVIGEDHAPRRASQANAIAANFQIPKSVNESGGSLAELAAQITCLFWFESSDVLQQVEDSLVPLHPTKPLTADAKPTTGFRKWVTTILSTTMVAQNVVVLALLFIYRLKTLNPRVNGKPGSEYRLLTVALMLGNKFLDDNTYTNKTWAEVSGINVGEVHIMEVEFLSNMKYCLFTCEQDWAKWQSLLGKFAAFFDHASRPLPPAPILPPASSLYLPMALPSPPVSNHASPPYSTDLAQTGALPSFGAQHGPTPAPSPLSIQPGTNAAPGQPRSRKRSYDDIATEPPPKRIASGYQTHTSPQRFSTLAPQSSQIHPVPRLTLPTLPAPPLQGYPAAYPQQAAAPSLPPPPLAVPVRATSMVYPNTSSQGHIAPAHATSGPSSQPNLSSRHQSPFQGSATNSPFHSEPQKATIMRPANQVSPTYFLQQRSSPYRPVHHVSTLLYPPPSAAMQTRPPTIELNRMQYQPLGKPTQHTGRLPYVSQNVWLDGSQPQEMTPIHQWPGMPAYASSKPQQQQQTTLHQ